MTHQAIPAQAVEAAAYALYLDANGDPEVQWFDITFHEQDELMRTATKALEAAAPHIRAQALEDAAAELDDKRLLSKAFHLFYPEWLRERATKMRPTP